MSEEIAVLAESSGFTNCFGGFRLVEPGIVVSLLEAADNTMLLRHTIIQESKKEVYEDLLTVDEARGFLKAVSTISKKQMGYGTEKGKPETYKSVMDRLDPEHWRKDDSIANRYALPYRGSKENDEKVVGKKGMKDPRTAKFVGRTFWSRPPVPGGYIDDLPKGEENG